MNGVWSSGGTILTGEIKRTRRETCPSATLSTTNPTFIGLSVNTVLSKVRNIMKDVILGWPFHMQKWFSKGDGLKIRGPLVWSRDLACCFIGPPLPTHEAIAAIRLRPPHYRGFTITLGRTPLDE
jgi:hypothetical protein